MKGEGDEDNSMVKIEQELDKSLSKAYELYNYMLCLIIAITHEARKYTDIEKARAERLGTEMPVERMANNRFAIQLEENEMLTEYVDEHHLTWDLRHDVVNQLFNDIIQSRVYKSYVESDDNYDSDREFWRKVYKTFISNNSDIDDALEEQSIYWNDDRGVVDSFVLKTIKRFEESKEEKQQLLHEYDEGDDQDYGRRLLRATLINGKEYQTLIAEASRNWEFNRLAFMDIIIMQIAIAEMVTFPSIPVEVTINEYVDLAKLYSTPQSGGYINGMLDAIARKLISSGKLKKTIAEKK